MSDKFKSEALHYHKCHQAEVMKNNDLVKMLGQAENTLKVRINQIEEGKGEIAALRAENGSLDEVNNRL